MGLYFRFHLLEIGVTKVKVPSGQGLPLIIVDPPS